MFISTLNAFLSALKREITRQTVTLIVTLVIKIVIVYGQPWIYAAILFLKLKALTKKPSKDIRLDEDSKEGSCGCQD
jgi:hypothetical protein